MSPTRRNQGRRRQGFTLIELLLVLMILVVLASMAFSMFAGTQERALKDAAKGAIGLLETQIDTYKIHMRAAPSSLEDLATQPSGDLATENWNGPYVKSANLKDPWGNEYRYTAQGKQNANGYDLWSVGPDGQDGTDDDIGNWDKG